jgi:hypothetical protein
MPSLLRSAVLGAVLTMGMASAALAQGYPPPPPLRYEVVPVVPGPRYVWEPGHWVWNGRAYAWIGGHYIVRRAAYHEYVHGHWGERYGHPVWIGPYWR